MRRTTPISETDRHDIELSVLLEAFVQTSGRKKAREFLDVLEKLIEYQEDLAERRIARLGPAKDPEALATARFEAAARLRVMLSLARRLIITRAA